MRRTPVVALGLSSLLVACAARSPAPDAPAAGPSKSAEPPARPITLSIVSTNDVHGHIEPLPRIGGLIANLRRVRAADGAVLVLDGGDAWQGELASNLAEGAPVVEAFNAIGYDAAALGNHEFDFGPVGPHAAPGPGEDPRGALIARAAQARYPLLSANLVEATTSKPFSPPNVRPSAIVTVAGVKVGVVGLLTLGTTQSVLAAVFAGLKLEPLADSLAREAKVVRDQGATVVIAVAHAGGGCTAFDNPDDLSSCGQDEEIFQVARALPPGTVDAIVAGHTHAGLAHRVNGIPIIEAGSNGRYVARVDLTVDPVSRRVSSNRPYPPLEVCARAAPTAGCAPLTYEGEPVNDDPKVAAVVRAALVNAEQRRNVDLGVTLAGPFERARSATESALSNLVADLMRQARPKADITLMHAGGLRANLAPGPLRYGAFYEVYPRDSTFATATLTGAELAAALETNFTGDEGSLVSISGARVKARCDGAHLAVTLQHQNGKPIGPREKLIVATNNLLATGAKGNLGGKSWEVEDDPPIREELVKVLVERGGVLSPDDKQLLDPSNPRIALPTPAPVRCSAASK